MSTKPFNVEGYRILAQRRPRKISLTPRRLVKVGKRDTAIKLFERDQAAPCCAVRSACSPQKRLYPKALTVFVDASPSGKHRAIQTAALAQRWDAHVIGVHVVFAGVRSHPPSESWAIGKRAFQAVIAHEKRLRADAEAVAAHVSEYFQDLCTRWNVDWELRRIDGHRPAQEAIFNALHSDLVIVGHPEPNGLPDDVTLETIFAAHPTGPSARIRRPGRRWRWKEILKRISGSGH